MQPSTVHKILRRYRCPPLVWTDPATGVRIKRARKQVNSYVHDAPGDLVHVDIKKLGRIPDGGGMALPGPSPKARAAKSRPSGYWYIHNAVDDHTRLAYSEMLTDERKKTAAGFWIRANAYFASRRHHRAAGCSPTTAPATDQASSPRRSATASSTNGPAPTGPRPTARCERFNRTMLEEWAYAQPYLSATERAACFPGWLHTYNHHRGHTSLGGMSPADLVPNLRGQNS